MINVKSTMMYESFSRVSGCEVVLNTWPKFDHTGAHVHSFVEIAYISAGDGWHGMGNQLYRCSPGDLFIVNVGDAHFWVSESDAPLTIHNLIFRPGFFDVSLIGKSNFGEVSASFLLEAFRDEWYYNSMHIHFDEHEQKDVQHLFESMQHEYDTQERGFEELIRAGTIALLVKVFRKHKHGSGRGKEHSAHSAALAPVFDYMETHYNENIPLKELAALAYLSPTYFSRVFRESTGSTVTEYMQNKRIYHAIEMLQTSNKPITSISEECGYTDVKHFTRLFKRIIGMAPSEYRKRLKPDDKK